MIDKTRVIVFDTDDEITNYCMELNPVVMYDETTQRPYYDYPYTPAYGKAIADGMSFMVKDPNSKVAKRGCVTRGLISKPLYNLVNPWDVFNGED